jgi:hypothetical protein
VSGVRACGVRRCFFVHDTSWVYITSCRQETSRFRFRPIFPNGRGGIAASNLNISGISQTICNSGDFVERARSGCVVRTRYYSSTPQGSYLPLWFLPVGITSPWGRTAHPYGAHPRRRRTLPSRLASASRQKGYRYGTVHA